MCETLHSFHLLRTKTSSEEKLFDSFMAVPQVFANTEMEA